LLLDREQLEGDLELEKMVRAHPGVSP